MLRQLYERRMSRIEVELDPTYIRLCPVEQVVDGVVCRTSQFKPSSNLDDFKDCGYQDFEIGNILSVGAVNLLKPVSMSNHDVVGVADSFDSLNSKLNGDEVVQ